jgi:hypothetical protein
MLLLFLCFRCVNDDRIMLIEFCSKIYFELHNKIFVARYSCHSTLVTLVQPSINRLAYRVKAVPYE